MNERNGTCTASVSKERFFSGFGYENLLSISIDPRTHAT